MGEVKPILTTPEPGFEEHEFKYKAGEIKYTEFVKLMKTIELKRTLDIASWDFYFTHPDDPNSFFRFRDSPTDPELTKKVKTQDGNNWKRVEIDLPLDRNRINYETVKEFLALIGYTENFRIYKTNFIYWTELSNYVYYIVFDHNMVEKDRFIEVELNKSKVKDIADVKVELNKAAEKLQELGLTSQNRLKKSLFEMYRKSIRSEG